MTQVRGCAEVKWRLARLDPPTYLPKALIQTYFPSQLTDPRRNAAEHVAYYSADFVNRSDQSWERPGHKEKVNETSQFRGRACIAVQSLLLPLLLGTLEFAPHPPIRS